MIPKNIISLVDLALKDAVLTFKEREVIVQQAQQQGIDANEINAFLDARLRQTLANRTKEQLKKCPHCGGQIPLIADQCLFCGKQFQNSTTPPPYVNISDQNSEAAKIINAENEKTELEEIEISNCQIAELHSHSSAIFAQTADTFCTPVKAPK